MKIKHRFDTATEANCYLERRGWRFLVCGYYGEDIFSHPDMPGQRRKVRKLRTGKWMIEREDVVTKLGEDDYDEEFVKGTPGSFARNNWAKKSIRKSASAR